MRSFPCLVAAALLLGSTSASAGPCQPQSWTTLISTTDTVAISSSTTALSSTSVTESVSETSATSTKGISSSISETSTASTTIVTSSTETSAIPGTTTSDFTTITTTTSQAPIPTVSQTFQVKAAQSDNTAVNGAVLHVTNNPSYALYLISPPRTSGSVLPGAFSIEEGTSRLMVGEWYVYTSAPDPYSMYAGPASSVGPNQAYISCTKPELVGEALQCSSATAGPIYFSVSSTATGSTNIMPWKVGSVHAGYSAVNLVAASKQVTSETSRVIQCCYS
ncbi:hypothetical protein NCS52_01506100 [Fusarium sp. LHS14.1]|nr:hypothetical protein NCS52_01506100 [Fusarium sp. LHS14.1]